jgi:hypothetical protein
MLSEFAKSGGYEKLIKTVQQRISADHIHIVFHILTQSIQLFHKEFLKEIGSYLKENIVAFLTDFSEKEIGSVKKETIDSMLKVLKTVLTFIVNSEEKSRLLEKLNITFATKMLKTTYLEKRIQAVKTLIDIIRSSKNDPTKSESIVLSELK